MKTKFTAIPRSALFLAASLLIPTLAQAHAGVGTTASFGFGFAHPLTGLDHLCAMVAVGLWAAQMGGRAIWAVPLTFVSVMAFGGFLGMAQIHLPLMETGVVLSILTLGIFIAAAVRLPLIASTGLVGLFALCHGHAHGEEMAAGISGLTYATGFIAATALLHGVGIALGMGIEKVSKPLVVRAAGGAIAFCGLCLWVG